MIFTGGVSDGADMWIGSLVPAWDASTTIRSLVKTGLIFLSLSLSLSLSLPECLKSVEMALV
jgi:hypothetical protein